PGKSSRTVAETQTGARAFSGWTGMMAGNSEDMLAVGGPARHIPVLLAEVLDALAAAPGQTIIDGTFGAGGYTKAILDAGASVVAIDRDPAAIEAGRTVEAASVGRLRLVHAP